MSEVRALPAAHFKGRVKFFELWNEPSLANGYDDSIAMLAKLQARARTILHGHGEKMLSPGVPFTNGSPKNGYNWLRSFLSKPGGKAYDITALHLYPSDASVRAGIGPEWSVTTSSGCRRSARRRAPARTTVRFAIDGRHSRRDDRGRLSSAMTGVDAKCTGMTASTSASSHGSAQVSQTIVDLHTSDRRGRGSEQVPVREMEFEQYVADLPKYFANGDIVMSHVLAVLSSTFPEGEKFFVRSVAAARDQISHPRLLADIDGFVGQEEMHGREHQVLNDRLAQHGYPTRGIDSYVRGLYWVRERIQTKKVNLAFTAALEHYTATLAELLLNDEQARQAVGQRGARDILTWHALEESEHKAVAYDVYKAVGGGEIMRIVVMLLTDLLFILETSIMGVVSVVKDRDVWRHPVRFARSLAGLRHSPFMSMRAVRILAEYHRPGFHPNDRDTTQLIADWRQALFGRDGELNAVRVN